MRRFVQFFMEGILILAPLALTVYVVTRVLAILESLGSTPLALLTGGGTSPGLGILLAVVLITLIGWLGGNFLARRVINAGEALLTRIPLVKSIYGSIKDVVDAFGGKKQSFSKAALVRIPGIPIELLGFVTSEDLDLLGDAGRDKVSVYVPQSLQIGGFVAVVPREHVTFLDSPPQQVLKFLMTAGMTHGGGDDQPDAPPARGSSRGRR